MNGMHNRVKLALAAAVGGITIVGGAAQATSLIGGDSRPIGAVLRDQASATARDELAAADVAGTLTMLAGPPQQHDSLPARALKALPQQAALNAGMARMALTTKRGTRLFVVPGERYACLVALDPTGHSSTSCNTLYELARGHMAGTTQSPFYRDDVLVRGLVPDGVSTATVEMSDGTEVVTSAVNNVYAVETRKTPVRVTWTLDGVERFAGLVRVAPRVPR